MAMNFEKVEEGEETKENRHNNNFSNDRHGNDGDSKIKSPMANWGLLLLSCTFNVVGTTAGPLLLRLYFLRGGSRKWLVSWLETVGFPILLIPLAILYYRRDRRLPKTEFFASPKQLAYFKV